MVPAPAALAGAAASSVAPALLGGVALAGDLILRVDLPKFELPKVELPKVELPKLELPKLSLPKLGGDAKDDKAIYIDDNPNAPSKPATGGVTVRAAPTAAGVEAPSLADLRKGVVVGNGSVTDEDWKAFPGRRMPGKNMESFLDWSKEYYKDKK